MKTLTKVGLSALAGALAVTSANAGEMSLSGSMVASYSKGSGYHTTGNPLAMDKELSVTGYHEPSLVFLAKGKIILSDPNEAAIFLAEGNNNLVLVEGRELDEFINSSSNLNLKLKKIREIRGFNYSKGQNIKILFFKVAK